MSVNQDMAGSSPSCADVHDLTAGFAFGALDPDEQVIVEQHCASCASCAIYVQQAKQTAMMLSFSVRTVDPPPIAKAELFARIAHQHQFPSQQITSIPTTRSSKPSPVARSTTKRFRLPLSQHLGFGQGGFTQVGWPVLATSYLAVPLVLVLVVVGGFAFRSRAEVTNLRQELAISQAQSDRLQSTITTIDSLVADTDSRVYLLPSRDTTAQNGYGKVYAKPGSSDAVLMVWGLNKQSAYQVMLEGRNGEMVPCGDFRVDGHGNAAVLFKFDQPFIMYESIQVIPAETESAPRDSWASAELLSAPINPIVGLPGDMNPLPTK